MIGLSPGEIAAMRGTVSPGHLIMRCDIERPQAGPGDDYGNEAATWLLLLEDVPCLWWIQDVRVDAERQTPNVNFTQASQMVELAAGTDVRENDRVTEVRGPLVRGQQGRAVLASDLDITEVRQRLTNTVLVVEDVR